MSHHYSSFINPRHEEKKLISLSPATFPALAAPPATRLLMSLLIVLVFDGRNKGVLSLVKAAGFKFIGSPSFSCSGSQHLQQGQ